MDTETKLNLTRNPALQSHHFDKLIGENDLNVHRALAENPSLPQEHADRMMNDYHERGQLAYIHPLLQNEGIKISPEHQKHFLASDTSNSGSSLSDNMRRIAARPDISDESKEKIVSGIENSNGPQARAIGSVLLDNPSFEGKPEHISTLLQSSHGPNLAAHILETDREGRFGKNSADKAVNTLVAKPDFAKESSHGSLNNRFRNPHYDENHIKALTDAGYNVSNTTDKLSKEDITKHIDNFHADIGKPDSVYNNILNQRRFGEEHVHQLIGHNNLSDAIVSHPKASARPIDSAMEKADPIMKRSLLNSTHVQKNHFEIAAKDPRMHGFLSSSVRTPPSVLDSISGSKYQHVRENLIGNRNTSKDTLKKMLAVEKHPEVKAALESKLGVLKESLSEMTVHSNVSPKEILRTASEDVQTYHSLPNLGDQNRIIKSTPYETIMYKKNDSGVHSFSRFTHYPEFTTHDIAHKGDGTADEIRDNIKKMHYMKNHPIVSDEKQSLGGEKLWDSWKESEPNVKHFRLANENGKTKMIETNHTGRLINGDPNLRMGYDENKL